MLARSGAGHTIMPEMRVVMPLTRVLLARGISLLLPSCDTRVVLPCRWMGIVCPIRSGVLRRVIGELGVRRHAHRVLQLVGKYWRGE